MRRKFKGKLDKADGNWQKVAITADEENLTVKITNEFGDSLGWCAGKHENRLEFVKEHNAGLISQIFYLNQDGRFLGKLKVSSKTATALSYAISEIRKKRYYNYRYKRLYDAIGEEAKKYDIMSVDIDRIIDDHVRYVEENYTVCSSCGMSFLDPMRDTPYPSKVCDKCIDEADKIRDEEIERDLKDYKDAVSEFSEAMKSMTNRLKGEDKT